MHCRIIGSGPVGLAFALFASRAGLARDQIRLDADRVRSLAVGSGSGPRRHLAISEGSRQLLSRIIPFPSAAKIASIDVQIAGRAGRTRIHASDFGLPALGHVLSWDSLATVLARTATAALALDDATVAHGDDAADDERIDVHAEGVIDAPAAERLAFGQSALLAEVRVDRPVAHPATAYERFDRHGPLALLPIGSDDDRFSMVWCDEDARSAERLRLGPQAIERQLAARFGDQLGTLTLDGPIEMAPLTRIRRAPARARSPGADRIPAVWIGNASQTLHPVAGQGLNLGLRDAFELARLLGDHVERCFVQQRSTPADGSSSGASHRQLQRTLHLFERERRFDRRVLVGVTDALALGFGTPALHGLQSALLTLLDVAPPLRRPLAATLLFGERR